MADRYWVGGNGTWNSATVTRWSATSGGASGASVPTAADNVFFDANSNTGTGAFTVTLANTPRVCNNLTISGLDGTMTLAGAGIGLTISGSLTFPATLFNRTYTGVTTFNSSASGNTITTNGVAFGANITFDGTGSWTLGSALNLGSNNINFSRGTLDTSSVGNYSITAGSIVPDAGFTRTLNLNGSTLTLSGNFPLNYGNLTSGLTLNAGTSQINLSSNSATLGGGFTSDFSFTYYNVSFTSTAIATAAIKGANTFNNLSLTGRTTVGIGSLSFSANQTINGTFTVSAGTASAYRMLISSNTIGTQRTLTCAAKSLTDVDFRDIVAAGAGSPFTGTRLGDCKGNSGITFDAAKTVYYGQTGSANWGATGSGSWSATSGGALDATMFPLAQDTAVFPAATYPASGSTTTINANYNIGTIDMSLRTSNTMTLAINTSISITGIYGNWTNGTGTTLTSSGSTLTFAGRQTQTITSAGITFPVNITIYNINNTVRIVDNLTLNNYLTLNDGTLDLNGYTFICSYFESYFYSSASPNLTFNGGTLQVGASFTASSGLTTTKGSGVGKIRMVGGSFDGANCTYNCTLELTVYTIIAGSNTFTTITNTVTPIAILFTDGSTTTVTNWDVNGTPGNLASIYPEDTGFTLSKAGGIVSSDYLNITRCAAIGGAIWYAGTNSVNNGGNTGWIFTAPPATATGNFFLMF